MYHPALAQLLKRQSRWQMFTQGQAFSVSRYWRGTTSTDPADINNWSDTDGGATPATNLPGTNDTAYFTANGNNPCTLTADLGLKSLVILSGYTAKIDLATFNLSLRGGNLTLDGAGEFDCGTGSHSISNGDFDYKDIGTWTCGTSTWILNGNCDIICKSAIAGKLYNLTIGEYAVVTQTISGGYQLQIHKHCEINGIYNIANNRTLLCYFTTTIAITTNGIVTGDGILVVYVKSNTGFTEFNGIISCHKLALKGAPNTDDSLFPANTYSPNILEIDNNSNTNRFFKFNSGNYIFDCDVVFNSINVAQVLTIDTDTYNANVLLTGNMTTNLLGATNQLIIDSGGDWEIQGDVDLAPSVGTATWQSGSGTMTFSGTADQDIDFNGEEIEDIEINKTTGTLTFTGDIKTGLFMGTQGTIDFNGQTIETGGDLRLLSTCDIIAGNDAMNGCVLTVGDNFVVAGSSGNLLNLRATSTWTLAAVFASSADYVDVSYSNATGVQIAATNSTDSGNNTNWAFS